MKKYPENYNNFSLDYEDIEDNVEYIEREDEFDGTLDLPLTKPKKETKEVKLAFEPQAEEDIDILKAEDEGKFDLDELLYLPAIPMSLARYEEEYYPASSESSDEGQLNIDTSDDV